MRGAQIVFVESDRGRAWRGRLLRQASAYLDVAGSVPRPVEGTPRFDIVESERGRFVDYIATIQGGHAGGRRYRTYRTLDEAQRAGIRWAARRFKVAP